MSIRANMNLTSWTLAATSPLAAACMLFVSIPADGQALYSAPTTLEGDRIRFLLSSRSYEPAALEFRAFARGDNNVVSLAQGDRRHIGPTLFSGQTAYLSDYHVQGVNWAQGHWRIAVESTAADLYEGNRDAGQLYVDSLSHTVDFHAAIAPQVTMNRSEINRIRAGRAFDLRLGDRAAVLLVTGSLLDVHRFQVGSVTGKNSGGQFVGDLTILTTLGVPPSQTRSPGASLDAALSADVAPRWRASISVENLVGQVWQRKLQRLDVTLKTNAVEPDANGFLHGVPVAQGRISFESADAGLRRRFDAGAAYSGRGNDWLLFISNDFDWRVATGINFQRGRDSRIWALVGFSPFEWQLGFDSSHWRFQFGMSAIDFEQAKRASASLTWRIPLGT